MANLARTEIIISDIHVGAGELDDCDGKLEAQLVHFLGSLSARRESPVELVINGDFLDFAQAEPWKGEKFEGAAGDIPLCFTEEQSLKKLNRIIESHKAVFQALNKFLKAPNDNRLVIMPGNHDVDFFWKGIRKRFSKEVYDTALLSADSPLQFYLEPVYRPAHLTHVHIEHGHQHDLCNRFIVHDELRWSEAALPIFIDSEGKERLLECVGTRFMVQCMNPLDFHYRFIDNIKPFSKFVDLFLLSIIRFHHGPFKALIAAYHMVKFLLKTIKTQPSDLLSNEKQEGVEEAVARSVQVRVDALSSAEQRQLTAALRALDFRISMPLPMFVADTASALDLLDFLAQHPNLYPSLEEDTSGLLSTADEGFGDDSAGLLSLGQGFLKIEDETQKLKIAAQHVLGARNARVVVMGHTHEPIDGDYGRGYFNTGSWTRQARLERLSASNLWQLISRNAEQDFPYRLLYMEITDSSAELKEFASEGVTT